MSLESEQLDHRAYQRIDLRNPVRFSFKDPQRFGGCLSYDISEGGVKLRFNEYVPVGTELVMSIQLDRGGIVECIGKVVWTRQIPFTDHYQIGLQFDDLDSILETRSRIRRFVRHS